MTESVSDRIKVLFDAASVSYELFEHAPVYTSAEAARVRDTDISMGAKALVCYADGRPALLVLPGDKKADFRKFKRTFGVKDLRMATKDEVKELTGLEVGAIPPVGRAMSIKSYYDASIAEKEKVTFNDGLHTVSMIMSVKDLLKVEVPIIADFAE